MCFDVYNTHLETIKDPECMLPSILLTVRTTSSIAKGIREKRPYITFLIPMFAITISYSLSTLISQKKKRRKVPCMGVRQRQSKLDTGKAPECRHVDLKCTPLSQMVSGQNQTNVLSRQEVNVLGIV